MSANGSENGSDDIAPNATYIALRTLREDVVHELTSAQINNINERVKIPTLVETLTELCGTYGTVLEVVAKKSLKRRGQAFVVFDDMENAQAAIDELNGFEIFGKQMRVQYAKTRSDVTVKNEDGEEAYEQHKTERLAEKRRKRAEELAAEAEGRSNKRKANDSGENGEHTTKFIKVPTAKTVEVPDEYLPANPTLTLRDVPEDTTKEELVGAFGDFPGFKDARTVPGRPFAFVEYTDADSAAAAKAATAGISIRGQIIKVTFRRS